MFLRDLTDPVSNLTGVGKTTVNAYSKIGISTYADLLGLNPRTYEDRRKIISVGKQDASGIVNTFVVVRSSTFFSAKHILKIIVTDISDPDNPRNLSLLCFNRNFLKDVMRPGKKFYLYATISQNYGELQSSSFEAVPFSKEDNPPPEFGQLIPIYPLSSNLSQKLIRRDINSVLQRVPLIDDELPPFIMQKYKLMSFDQAIRTIHHPPTLEDVEKARRTLAFNETFYLQLSLRRDVNTSEAKGVNEVTTLEQYLITSLPFSLTKDQVTTLREIREDMSSGIHMNRLLQGDVGSGKTLVAWISALHIISEGGQVAFMAPTELLARQHAQKASELLKPLGIRVAFLTGSVSTKQRLPLLDALVNGEIDILIGTHALFSKNVVFKNLRYIIIDEQHRFGVEQRLALRNKGESPDVLMMTATPIPRTLALTVFGNLNVSSLNTMPEGRLPIKTMTVSEEKRNAMFDAIGVEFVRGHQAYFIYPRIEENPENELRDVTSMFEYLKTVYPGIPSALLHSHLDEETKVNILNDYAQGKITYLVSTSVVEVGIDVANATCMVIEHAELFGLSALHQLRGRVGRSNLQSYCFLVFSDNLTDEAKRRLRVMKETTDGFIIAEEDLKIRGAGEFTGVRQSGFTHMKYANLETDFKMLETARKDVDQILLEDPGLLNEEHSILRKMIASQKLI